MPPPISGFHGTEPHRADWRCLVVLSWGFSRRRKRNSENRIARMDSELAVELSKLAHATAYTHGVDEDALHKLPLKCLGEITH